VQATLQADELRNACKTVSPALGGFRSVQSMLRIEIQADHGCVEARNEYWGISKTVGATDIEAGTVLVPSRPFQALLDSIEGSVTLRTDAASGRLLVSAAMTAMELSVGSNDDWIVRSIAESEPITLPNEDLARIGRITFAAAKDLSRPLLTAVRLDGDLASATDTRRIAQARLSVQLPSISVPAEFMLDVSRHATSDVHVVVDMAGIQLSDGGTTWSSRAMVGDYPDLKRFLSLEPSASVTVARSSLLASLQRMRVFESDNASVRITTEANILKLWTQHLEFGEISDQIDAHVQFVGTVWFNSKVLTEAIQAHDSEEVSLLIEAPLDPIILNGSRISQVVMPRAVSDTTRT